MGAGRASEQAAHLLVVFSVPSRSVVHPAAAAAHAGFAAPQEEESKIGYTRVEYFHEQKANKLFRVPSVGVKVLVVQNDKRNELKATR